MIEIFTGAVGLGALGYALRLGFHWLHHDGLVRLMAGTIAVVHPDATRRKDARTVLRDTRGRASGSDT